MDEYIELLDENNTPNGVRCLKSVAHKNGYLHASVHIWFYTKDKQLLIQKRHHTKSIFPNLWDVSVAGHIEYKELPIDAALRETAEEIGLTISVDDLKHIGTSLHKHKHPNNIIDHELHHIYAVKLNTTIHGLKIQEEELSEIKLISIDTLNLELNNNTANYVPHGPEYYQSVTNAIKQLTDK